MNKLYKQPVRKPRSKKLSNQELLVLPFYDDVGILKKQKGFRNYSETYEVKTIDNKSLDDSLFLSKTSIKIYLLIYQEKKGVLTIS